MDLMVGDLMAVADAAGLERFHLVGESAGGTAALAAAISCPGRIASLTVSNGAANGSAIQNVRGVWNERLGDAGRDAWVDRMMEWRFFADGLPKEKYEWFRNQQATCSAEATTGIAALLLRTDLSEAVSRIATPTLILSPDSSPFITGRHGRRSPGENPRRGIARVCAFAPWSPAFTWARMRRQRCWRFLAGAADVPVTGPATESGGRFGAVDGLAQDVLRLRLGPASFVFG